MLEIVDKNAEAIMQRCSSIKYGASIRSYSFRIAVLNIFKKFLKQHQQQSSYSASLYVFSICALFGMVFQEFSPKFSKNTAGKTLLILCDCFLKFSRKLFKPLMPVGNKRSYIHKQTSNKDLQVCLSMYVLLLPPALKG